MDPTVARRIACRHHRGQRTRFGDSVIDHIRRIATAVSPEARATAWLHDLFELTPVDRTELRARGLTPVESKALELLTRARNEPYRSYVLRIAVAPGAAGGVMASHLPGFPISAAVAVGIGCGTVAILRLPLSAVVLAALLTSKAGPGVEPLAITGVVVTYLVTLRLSALQSARSTRASAVTESGTGMPAPVAAK